MKKLLLITLMMMTFGIANSQVRVQGSTTTLTKARAMFWNAVPENADGGDLWEMIPNMAYTITYRISNRFYMLDIYVDPWKYGDLQELEIVDISSMATQLRYVDDTGEIFAVTRDCILGYYFGDLASTWPNVPTR